MSEIVLLHGFCESSKMWKGTEKYLRSLNHITHSLDLPGFGTNESVVHSIAEMSSYVINFLDRNRIDKCVLLGHSLGGYIALDILNSYPERVSGVGMIHSHAAADDANKKANRKKLIAFVSEHGLKPFLSEFVKQLVSPNNTSKLLINQVYDLVKDTKPAGVIAASHAMINRHDYTELLATTKVPFLWLIGRQDSFIGLAEVLTQASSCEQATIEVLDGVGHLSVYEKPLKANKIIAEFVAELTK